MRRASALNALTRVLLGNGIGRSCDRFLKDERDSRMSAGYAATSSAGGHSGHGTVCGAGDRRIGPQIATQDMYIRSGAERFGILGARGATLSPDEICSVDAVSVAVGVALHDDIDFCKVETRI